MPATTAPGIALPRRRPRSRPAPRAPIAPRRLLGALTALPDARLLDRLIRGRLWIGFVAFALIGIVAMQLMLLKLNTGIGHAIEHEQLLQRQNASLEIAVSDAAAPDRVEGEAQRLGMSPAAPGAIQYLSGSGSALLSAAVRPLATAVTPSSTGAATSAGSSGVAATTGATMGVTDGAAATAAPATTAAATGATTSTGAGVAGATAGSGGSPAGTGTPSAGTGSVAGAGATPSGTYGTSGSGAGAPGGASATATVGAGDGASPSGATSATGGAGPSGGAVASSGTPTGG